MKTAAIIILTLIGITWTILDTVMNQIESEKRQYCSACHVCERRLCEDENDGN